MGIFHNLGRSAGKHQEYCRRSPGPWDQLPEGVKKKDAWGRRGEVMVGCNFWVRCPKNEIHQPRMVEKLMKIDGCTL